MKKQLWVGISYRLIVSSLWTRGTTNYGRDGNLFHLQKTRSNIPGGHHQTICCGILLERGYAMIRACQNSFNRMGLYHLIPVPLEMGISTNLLQQGFYMIRGRTLYQGQGAHQEMLVFVKDENHVDTLRQSYARHEMLKKLLRQNHWRSFLLLLTITNLLLWKAIQMIKR